ncbi:MAG: glycosyltransferase involved in cell wall biosynthesis [Mariniblastus sp.]|jgi:glycosyltransferase involved in cell wall biosynthesis
MDYSDKKLIYLTAGAGGMFCGSCMHDNALSRALSEHGWNIQLVPTYTPIRTDESDFSVDQVLFGGINVYLQQKIPLLRYLPAALDRFLDSPWLIRKATSRAMETNATMLGKLAHSMLLGSRGNQKKEVRKICKWLKLSQPDLIIFSNILIGGCIEDLKRDVDVPILVTLQGDDVFLDSLKEPYKSRCLERAKQIVSHVDGFIVQSEFFRDYMSDYFSIDPAKVHVTPLGLNVEDFASFVVKGEAKILAKSLASSSPTRTIGYMARLAPEKGLHHLVDSFIKLKSQPNSDHVKLKVAGWLSPENEAYAQSQWDRLAAAGLSDEFEYLGSIDRDSKLDFFRQIDVLSVPTEFQEPKGLYALESLAAGVPVVLPAHGAFPELIAQSGGGALFQPGDTNALAAELWRILDDDAQRELWGRQGQSFVHGSRNAQSMAKSTSQLIERFLN